MNNDEREKVNNALVNLDREITGTLGRKLAIVMVTFDNDTKAMSFHTNVENKQDAVDMMKEALEWQEVEDNALKMLHEIYGRLNDE